MTNALLSTIIIGLGPHGQILQIVRDFPKLSIADIIDKSDLVLRSIDLDASLEFMIFRHSLTQCERMLL